MKDSKCSNSSCHTGSTKPECLSKSGMAGRIVKVVAKAL